MNTKAAAWSLLGVQLCLIAAVVFLPAADDWSLPSTVLKTAHVLSLIGLGIVIGGLLNLGRSVTPLPTPVAHGTLRTTGLYALVRHPVYSGLMLWCVMTAVGAGSIWIALASVSLVGWLVLKATWEERRLRERYPAYAAYAERTPRFIPFAKGFPGRGQEA